MAGKKGLPPIAVVFGEERARKADELARLLDELLPPGTDRGMALIEYDGSRPEDSGGASFATIADELHTLPFLADRRVVVVRDADAFISRCREPLERYAARPSPAGTLVLECRSFPKTTRFHKAVLAAGGSVTELRRLAPREAVELVTTAVRQRGKRIDAQTAERLVNLVGPEYGPLLSEVEKLCLYCAARAEVRADDVSDLVGESREERIFAVMDAALDGSLPDALKLWRQVVTTDRAAAFKALGGIAYVLRGRLAAHRMAADGLPLSAIAPKLLMFRRERDLERQLRRFPAPRLQRMLASLAQLDLHSKLGLASVERGVEVFLVQTCGRGHDGASRAAGRPAAASAPGSA